LPGYPAFLATFYKLFDFDITKTLWMQIIFACIIPILIFGFSLILFPQNLLLAKIVSFYSAIHVGFITYSGLLMSETFFMIFFLLFCILFFSRYWFLSGISLGFASLFRPVGHYIVIISVLLILFALARKPCRAIARRVTADSFLVFLGWFLIISVWLLRNYLLTGFIFFNTLPGKHFLNHSAAYVVGKSENISYKEAKDKLTEELIDLEIEQEKKLGRKLNAIEECKLAENLSWKHHIKHPILFLKFSITNILKTSFNLYSEEFSFIEEKQKMHICRQGDTLFERIKNMLLPKISNKWLRAISYLEFILFIFILIGFCGFVVTIGKCPALPELVEGSNNTNGLKTLPFIVLFIFLTLAAGFARLRLPAEPFIMILSFEFWINLFKR